MATSRSGKMEQRNMTTETIALENIADMIRSGKIDEARGALNGCAETEENRAELMFLRGLAQELSLERVEALETYQAVLEQNPQHAEACFRAALLADQFGDAEAAIALYEQCTEMEPVYANALVNLAVLYEEAGKLPQAEVCLENVLDVYPTHHRASHFLKSVSSSYTMQYDERSLHEREQRCALLDMPISDFELSVRSRNCLRQMNIRTLGDLLKTAEHELLSYKNFGETSLNEVKAMLEQKGLALGRATPPPEAPAETPTLPAPPVVPPAGEAGFNRSVAELELSVRSRKALQRLGVVTLGELVAHSEAELMGIKNFGQTSLTEIKQQLARFGVSLRSQ